MSFVSFIIPTINRPSLVSAVESLVGQTDPDWRAFVMGDGIEPGESEDERVHSRIASRSESPGATRNEAMVWVDSLHIQSEWIGFLDDDDRLGLFYVEHLKKHVTEENPDLIVFRMAHPTLGILPKIQDTRIEQGHVGISFAIRRGFWAMSRLKFITRHEQGVRHEDFEFVHTAQGLGAKIFISPYVDYVARA